MYQIEFDKRLLSSLENYCVSYEPTEEELDSIITQIRNEEVKFIINSIINKEKNERKD